MGRLGGEELGAEIADLLVDCAALAGLTEFELGVGGEEALMVGGTAEGLFATRLVVWSVNDPLADKESEILNVLGQR